jgi:hypothetical protein
VVVDHQGIAAGVQAGGIGQEGMAVHGLRGHIKTAKAPRGARIHLAHMVTITPRPGGNRMSANSAKSPPMP